MSLLTSLARLRAIDEGIAQPIATVRHCHLSARPMVFIPLKLAGEAAAPRLAWRPLLVIAGSVALFAVLLDRAGLVLTTAGIVALSRAGRAGHPWRETLLLAGGAALGAALVFRYGLGMQLPLWPDLG